MNLVMGIIDVKLMDSGEPVWLGLGFMDCSFTISADGGCSHYWTCDGPPPNFDCDPRQPEGCGTGKKCVDRGCVPKQQPGQIPPPSGGGIKVTWKATGPDGGKIGIQKVDHITGIYVGKPIHVMIPPNRSAEQVAGDFCTFANFMGIYCKAEGKVAWFYSKQLDIYYTYTPTDLSEHDDIGFSS